MQDKISEITFQMQDGRRIKVSEYGGSWSQYNVRKWEMLPPEFLDQFWRLLGEWEMIDTYY